MRPIRLLAALSLGPALILAACSGDDGVDPVDASADAPDGAAPDAVEASDGGADASARCPDYEPLKRVLFGDLHDHTSYSADAYTFDTRNTPLDAYAFARGKALQIAGAAPDGGGPITKIDRPLDFLAVTDHAEFLAVAYGCGADLNGAPYDPARTIFDTRGCRAFRGGERTLQLAAIFGVLRNVCDGGACEPVVKSAWDKEQAAAAAANDRCKFTSFVGYEWTKTAGGVTLHKNVVFAGEKVPARPFDSLSHDTQEALWSALAGECRPEQGCDAVTIPHNSNLSQGLAFEVPAAAADSANMARYQKLVEIFQHKGASECLSQDDPDCAFELLPDTTDPVRDKPAYVRDALLKGLGHAKASGTNPLMMGIVGATDDHDGTPGAVKESTYAGHAGSLEDTPEERISVADAGGATEFSTFNPGGLTAVWAEENTRESIFAAFQRRETYATSGPRIVVRFYQTFDPGDPCADPSFPKALVDKGAVPMGGTYALGATKPRFVVRAWRDQVDLARVDIVKGWVDGAGVAREKVVRAPLAGADAAAACFVWQDEEAAAGPAFYYARVLEVPTPRWSAYDCARAPAANPAGCADGGALRTMIQERAWTSPIWQVP